MSFETPKDTEQPTFTSKVYSEKFINNDYKLLLEGSTKYNTNLSIKEKQEALFNFSLSQDDPIQAWEYKLGKKWDEWNKEEKSIVFKKLTPEQVQEYNHLF